jgi:hypothetical protein
MARTEAEGTEPEATPTTHPVYALGGRPGLDHLRSARTARNTSPPDRTACTVDREASESATTCRERHDPPHQEPPRAKQIGGAAYRMAHPDRSGEHRAAMLEQETQIGAERRPQRKDQSQDHRSGLSVPRRSAGPDDARPPPTGATSTSCLGRRAGKGSNVSSRAGPVSRTSAPSSKVTEAQPRGGVEREASDRNLRGQPLIRP